MVYFRSMALAAAFGGVMLAVYVREKQRIARAIKSVGDLDLGGPFELLDAQGNTVTDKDFHGKYLLVYFGFTHCPDICPSELSKIGKAMEILERKHAPWAAMIQPIFITIDPDRDSSAKVEPYVKSFHPKFIGLGGSMEQISAAAREYRAFFRPARVEAAVEAAAAAADEGKEGDGDAEKEDGGEEVDDDYQLDHTIITYYMGPDGKIIEYYGFDVRAETMAARIAEFLPRPWWKFWI